MPINTPISFSGDMNLVGYSEQYYTIINGTISDTITFGNGGFPDWDNSPFQDQVSYFNEKTLLIHGIRVIHQLVISLQGDWTLSSLQIVS